MTEEERLRIVGKFIDLAYTEEDLDMRAMLMSYVLTAKWTRAAILQSGCEL